MKQTMITLWILVILTGCTATGKQRTLQAVDAVAHLTGKVDEFGDAHDALHAEIEALETEDKPWWQILGSIGGGLLGLHYYRNRTRERDWA